MPQVTEQTHAARDTCIHEEGLRTQGWPEEVLWEEYRRLWIIF
jgi:hypothetical protein